MTTRVGVIGTGMIGRSHIDRLTRRVAGARVTAVTDLDGDRARSVAAALPDAKAWETGHQVIADDEVDAVLVTSYGPAHAESVLAAIDAGKPVFCEKPLATTAEDCLRIVEAEAAGGVRLVQVGFMRRYDAGFRAIKQVIGSGEIGVPLMAHCAHRNPSVDESYHSAMAAQDTAVHEIDTLRWLLDDEIASAQVLTPRSTSHRFAHLTDPQIMLFETSRGARADVEVFVNCQYGYDIRCEVVGETGTAALPESAGAVVRTDGQWRGGVPGGWPERFGPAFDTEFQEWIDSVAAGAITGPTAWDGYAATVVTDATVEALRSGRVVGIEMKDRPAFYTEAHDEART